MDIAKLHTTLHDINIMNIFKGFIQLINIRSFWFNFVLYISN